MTPCEELGAKIANERLKLFAGLLNSLAVSALIRAIVAPIIGRAIVDLFWSLLVAGLGLMLHLLAHLVLDFLEPER